MEKKYTKSFQLYKPRKDNSGHASQWCFSPDKTSVFLEFSKQKLDDSGKFDWDNKCVMKLGVFDIGEILSVLNKNQDGVGMLDRDGKRKGLFHKNPKGTTILTFQYLEEYKAFGIRLNQKFNDSKLQVLKHTITFGEAEILKIFLQQCIEILYGQETKNKEG